MFNNKSGENTCATPTGRNSRGNLFIICDAFDEMETGTLEVTGIGNLRVRNTGGASAAEGGMGSGSRDDKEQGKLQKPGEKSDDGSKDDDSDTSFDPIKKKVKEAEKDND